jgi:endonuclease/exonuclease/phosphatase family metal-dependent hydrolase
MTMRKACRILVGGGFALAWAGVICRGLDGWLIPALIYYATPWLARLAAGSLAIFTFRHGGLRAMAGACMVISLVEGWHSFRLDPLPAIPAGAPVVSVWNAGRALDRKPAAWPALAAADLSAVVECGSFDEGEWRRFTAVAPDHEWRRFDGSTMLGVRGRILSHESLGVHDRFRCHRVRVELPGHGELTVVVADVRSQPWISRELALAGILRAAGDDPRAIILGDFNTPPESVWFREWRTRGFTLANDGPRRGFRETWAYGLPLLTLDHVWLASGWKVSRRDLLRLGSDHLAVKVTLSR